MAAIRIAGASPEALDRSLIGLGSLILARRGGEVWVEVADGELGALCRQLAFSGVATAPADSFPAADPMLVPAVGRTLAPLPAGSAGVDIVWLSAVPLRIVSRELLGPRLRWRPDGTRRERCRALLRGEDECFAWRRRCWLGAVALRDPRVRAVARPIVFDREALASTSPAGQVYLSAGAVGRWAFS